VIGGVAQATKHLRLGTGVTCPTIRTHPAIIAQAAATSAAMLPGRFMLGVGTGENLNEHILGDRWPPADVRREMLEEAVEIIRLLWQGGQQSFYGRYYVLENARLYTLPNEPPPILVASGGKRSAELAGQIGDGLVATAPNQEVIGTFRETGGEDKPCYAEMTVCWAKSKEDGIRTVLELWPNVALPGELAQELAVPAHFEQATKLVRREDVAEDIACGPDPEPYLDMLRKYVDAGFSHVWFHQVGPDQEGFFRFFERELRKKVESLAAGSRA